MTISIRLFARARDLAGQETIELDLPDDAVVADLKAALAQQVPALRPLLPQLFIAINEEYATETDLIPPAARIACFPPVSGG